MFIMSDEKVSHSISMGASKLSWDMIDKRADSIGFTNRSGYIQYLCERDIYRSRLDYTMLFDLLILASLSVIILILIFLR